MKNQTVVAEVEPKNAKPCCSDSNEQFQNQEISSEEDLKAIVREKYSAIANQTLSQNLTSCCGAGGCGTVDYSIMSESYEGKEGYYAEADLGLGCGLPTEYADIQEGNTVLDLGSGAGNDCFVARSIVGEKGKVIGVDMTPIMIEKARKNAQKLGFNNVEFRLGEIENLPVETNSVDVVISNCVMNLVPNKKRAFAETFRVLKEGAHFSISDIVLKGELPKGLKEAAEMYAGCVSGATQKDEYIRIIENSGFQKITVQKEREILIPDDILRQFLDEKGLKEFKDRKIGIFSITVKAQKPISGDCLVC
ncbi:MAG: arsenite methyltransferase [Flammeovirgaceae bacterium]